MGAEVHDVGTGTAVRGSEPHIGPAELPNQRVLAANGVPAVAPLPVPVVIAGDEQALRAPFPDREHLGSEPALRILPIRVTDRGHATGVDIVTQEHDELADRTEGVRLERQLPQHRLAVVGLTAGVADEKDGDLDAVPRRDRGGDGCGRLQRGAAGGHRDGDRDGARSSGGVAYPVIVALAPAPSSLMSRVRSGAIAMPSGWRWRLV